MIHSKESITVISLFDVDKRNIVQAKNVRTTVVTTLGQSETDDINQIITISKFRLLLS
jgi:hypothetical protein